MAVGDGVSALAQLGVTFGGFSPTAMDGVQATREIVERVEAEQARQREAARRRRELLMARTSKPMTFVQGGTTWTYVVVDGTLARIVACETTEEVLRVPGTVNGVKVYEIAPDACANLDSVVEVVCDDDIESIGACAFRLCDNLRSVHFPAAVADYHSSWVSHCGKLEAIELPGRLDVIRPSVFEGHDVKKLVVGPLVHSIEPGAFRAAELDEIVISEDNPFIATDGVAVYSADGSSLIAVAAPVPEYSIAEGCTVVCKKAFDNKAGMRDVRVPEGVRTIGEYAFINSGISSFRAPASLVSIEKKAFFHCKELRSVELNEGLASIGDAAFEESAITGLMIPASIQHIGNDVTVRTAVVHSGPGRTMFIDEKSELLFLDGEGGLYRHEDDGVHLVQLIDRETESYRVLGGTVAVNPNAFAHQVALRSVQVVEGVRTIGDYAFRYCTSLEHVELPESLESIGEGAFLDTSLASIRISANLRALGADALVTRGAHRGESVPSLRDVQVEEGNSSFYTECGMLCRRGEAYDSVVVFTSSQPDVVIPEQIGRIEAYAFNNARDIRYLALNKGLELIGTAGLATWCWIEHIHVEVKEPIEGRSVFDFFFPNTTRSRHCISTGIGGATWVNVPGIMAQYDICIAHAHDYNSKSSADSISIYEQVRLIVDRLRDPFLLAEVSRGMYERLLRSHIVEMCVDIARHDDREVIDYLVELGYVNGDNLEEIIMAVSRLQDAAMTGYLLELKRRRFGRSAFDFDL